jgi:hypothetical protein
MKQGDAHHREIPNSLGSSILGNDPAATSAGGLTAQALSIAVTSTLRAAGWPSDLPYLPP